MNSSSNASLSASARMQDLEYLYASNTNVSNFVSVKLSGKSNYHVWKSQMLCLLECNNMGGIVDPTFVGPRYSGTDTIVRQYDSLARGWILGSINEDIIAVVHNLGSAKEIWDRLTCIYDPSSQEGLTSSRQKTETETKNDDTQNSEHKKKLHTSTIKGDWSEAEIILKEHTELATEPITSEGSTILHIAVGIGHNDFVKNLLNSYLNNKQVLEGRNSDGSTPLHIAAIVGNKYAAELLVKKNHELLQKEDHECKQPLHKAFENMQLDTIGYLFKAIKVHGKSDSVKPGDEIGVDLLVNGFSAKYYGLVSDMVNEFPQFAKSDKVLTAIAKTFPSGLGYGESLIYPPSLDNALKRLGNTAVFTVCTFGFPVLFLEYLVSEAPTDRQEIFYMLGTLVIFTVPALLASPFVFIYLLILVVGFILLFLYSLLWKGAAIIFGPIKNIEKKKKEWDDAKKVLVMVCDVIDKLGCFGTDHYYTQPLLEAASHDAYVVVDEILFRSPEAIQIRDKNGYDIIQLAILKRSEKVYNLIYDIGERKTLYSTCKDSSENNILHLAGRLAPSNVLNQRTGAALQLQRELQWREEVKKFVFPTYITQENIFKETPDMIFTREHKHLVKEGEQWMKTTAESCSITAALIATIVFAAAITVPGGNNSENGIPLFKNEIAFIIFAISDAISLFASSTALLVFLSILTARFAENDFLVSLPRRLFIGLFSLLLSTTAMMVAFSSSLFLVFSNKKLWKLAPICGLAFIPIAFFVGLQFPLMVDLFRSTYMRVFGKQRKNIQRRFNPDSIRLLFGTNIQGGIRGIMKKNDNQEIQLPTVQTRKYSQLWRNN